MRTFILVCPERRVERRYRLAVIRLWTGAITLMLYTFLIVLLAR